MDNYQAQVLSPEQLRKRKAAELESRAAMEIQARDEAQQNQKVENSKYSRLQNKNILERQILDRDRFREVEREMARRDFEENKMKGAQVSQLDALNRQEKREKQAKYKEMLDNQMQFNSHLKLYGNMTNVEKKMNKDDLKAWQNYDDNQYSLIPGLNSRKLINHDKRDQIHKKERSLVEDQQRLQQFGFTRE